MRIPNWIANAKFTRRTTLNRHPNFAAFRNGVSKCQKSSVPELTEQSFPMSRPPQSRPAGHVRATGDRFVTGIRYIACWHDGDWQAPPGCDSFQTLYRGGTPVRLSEGRTEMSCCGMTTVRLGVDQRLWTSVECWMRRWFIMGGRIRSNPPNVTGQGVRVGRSALARKTSPRR